MFSSAIRIPRVISVAPTSVHSGTLFLFHGSGSNGEDFKEWIDILNRRELNFPHLKIVYPSAPIQLSTANGGMPSNVWFDRKALSINVPEVRESIDVMCEKVSELINKEVSSGIPLNRILVGGFSMGGGLSMYLAYRFQRSLAGCVAMSSFLNHNSYVYKALENDPSDSLPELLQFHGTSDAMVPFEWGKTTFDTLSSLNVKGSFVTLDSADHELVKSELHQLKDWILKKIPEK